MRDQESILFEAEYWAHVLADVVAINDLIAAAAAPVPEISMGLLGLLIGADAARADRVGLISTELGKVQPPIIEAQERITNLIRLAEGRLNALRGEADLEAVT